MAEKTKKRSVEEAILTWQAFQAQKVFQEAMKKDGTHPGSVATGLKDRLTDCIFNAFANNPDSIYGLENFKNIAGNAANTFLNLTFELNFEKEQNNIGETK
jgi:hypothetical protein